MPGSDPCLGKSEMRERSLQSNLFWLSALKEMDSSLLDYVDPDRIDEATRVTEGVAGERDEFSSNPSEGRGISYIRAQTRLNVRRQGIETLLRKFRRASGPNPPETVIADLLGGDGLIARLLRADTNDFRGYSVLTSDVSEDMVRAALHQGLPAIRQAAQSLVLKDESVDGVLLAYGTHHIPCSDRGDVCAEALRVLKPGGRLVIHDFPNDSPVAEWFGEVVHPYSKTGHEHDHFEFQELRELMQQARFETVEVEMIYDPLVVVEPSSAAAWKALGKYLIDMYGLDLLTEELGHDLAVQRALGLARSCFVYDYKAMGLPTEFGACLPTESVRSDGVRVECPRVAVVATGLKPAC
jgi:ubiquinone/menaquinone biosynthesis C-methylase UbiE